MTARAVVWRSRAARYAIAAVPVWFTLAVLVFHTPWRIKLIVGASLVGGTLFPASALIAVAVLAPLSRLVNIALGLQTFRVGEAVVVAFLAGWLMAPRRDAPGPRLPAVWTWLAALAICASLAAQAWRVAQFPGVLRDTLQLLYQAYYIVPDRIGFDAAARLLEGIGLLAAAVTLFRSHPRLGDRIPAALTGGAVVAAACSVLLSRHIGFARLVAEAATTAPRFAGHLGDVNAAGSYFGMMLLVALGFAARRSASAVLWLSCAALEAGALWLSGSRTAAAATGIIGGAAVCFRLMACSSPAARRTALAAILIAGLAAGAIRAWTLRLDIGTDFRREFYATSARMIAARPVVGVGIGQYYDTSPLYLSRFLGWFYGAENAHNYYLQLAAELGLLGAVPVLVLFAVPLVRGARALLARPRDMRLVGCEAGVAALLATCLTGHPLLLDEVSAAFWLLAGTLLAIASAPGAPGDFDEPGRQPPRLAAAALTVGVVAVYLAGARRPLAPPEAVGVTGLEPWERSPDGSRYRWTLDYAGVFVPRGATRVHIPVRLPVDTPQVAPMNVDVRVAGRDRLRSRVGREWTILNVELAPITTLQAYRRIDLRVERTWQPAIYVPGSRDLRHVGVQVGEIEIFFEN